MHSLSSTCRDILLAGLRPVAPLRLTPHELSRCVELLGKGWTLQRALDRIQADRPSLPLDPPEAA